MNNAHEHGGWTISEVERLTGLPRRDIQRCCYSGKGGLGIVKPQDSTWGRRTYSARDVATLFVVRLEKQQGLSLPEIGEKLRKHPATGSEAEPGLLAVHIERLKERQEEVAGQLLAARALLMASQGEEPSLAGELTENEIDAQVVETLRKMADEEGRQEVCLPAVPPIAGGLFALLHHLRRMSILLKHQCAPRLRLQARLTTSMDVTTCRMLLQREF